MNQKINKNRMSYGKMKGVSNMANCKDCSKYQDCVFVENGDVDVYAENKEIS